MLTFADDLEVRRSDISSPVGQQLILALNTELVSRYPEEGANFFRLDADEVAEGCGGFFVAYQHDTPVGCGAIRTFELGIGEIKRMYVVPEHRGRRVGGTILAALEAEAARLRFNRIVLETGPRQPDAIAMYSRAGYAHIPLFGQYVGSNFSVCMAKNLPTH